MKKVLHWLDAYLEESLLCLALALMAIIMGIQVFSRYVLSTSLSWSEELTRYLFIWSGFLSVSYCSKYCISIKIEQFAAKLKRRNRAILKVINHTIELVFFIYMIPFAFSFLMSSVYNGQVSPACQIPMYYVQAAPFVSFVLVAIRILQRWIIEFKIALGKPVYDPAHPERNTQEAIIKANTDEEVESMLDPADDKVLHKDLKEIDLSGDDYRHEDSMHNDEASSHIKEESDNEADREGDSV